MGRTCCKSSEPLGATTAAEGQLCVVLFLHLDRRRGEAFAPEAPNLLRLLPFVSFDDNDIEQRQPRKTIIIIITLLFHPTLTLTLTHQRGGQQPPKLHGGFDQTKSRHKPSLRKYRTLSAQANTQVAAGTTCVYTVILLYFAAKRTQLRIESNWRSTPNIRPDRLG
uniref:Secreted protein n=1 Tax=Panagrellus redivivus TaxID=6233 RepID=A0A7E4UZY3_PANRE